MRDTPPKTLSLERVTVRAIFEHGERVYADRDLVAFDGVIFQRASYQSTVRAGRKPKANNPRFGLNLNLTLDRMPSEGSIGVEPLNS